ncbi:VOC family protein [Bacillus sp. 03113]|uniref:VOC family protein n=1 Tax=Bacillus sp. 03113 TaxID=2578211 RepID=UPI001141D99A|nr:VOC family protein [Bacillus sp. 03113]
MSFHKKPVTFVSYVHLIVQQLERSLLFYEGLLGFQILERTENKVTLTVDGENPLVTIEQPEGVLPKEPRRSGLYHFALLLPSRKELAKVLQHFIDIKYPSIQGASDHFVSEALYLADPDGNGIEIYVDRPSEGWKWNGEEVYMTTEAIDIPNLLSEAKGEKFTGLPSTTIMGHIHLHVSDLVKADEFYVKGLGFNIVHRLSNHAHFLSTGGYHHHIGLNTWNGTGAPAPSPNSVSLKYYKIVFGDEAARSSAIQNLQQLGYTVSSYMVKDPSGTHIHLEVNDL